MTIHESSYCHQNKREYDLFVFVFVMKNKFERILFPCQLWYFFYVSTKHVLIWLYIYTFRID